MTRPGPKVPLFDMPSVVARLQAGESGDAVAADIGVSVRTLSRRAKEEGLWEAWTAASRNHIPLLPCGTSASYWRGCRCRECTDAHSARHAAWKAGAALRTPPDSVHGTVGGYSNWACRCDPCTEANKQACKDYAKQRRSA